MSVDLKKRFDRIVDILIQLQSKRIIKAQELANRFDVSLRTIYRDIKSLEQAGVPIIGEAGTGYSLVEGYKLPPVIFTKEEAFSFIGAEKLMEKFMDNHMIEDFKSAIYKIKSVLKYSEKDLLTALENQIHLSAPTYDSFNKNVPHALRTFFKSIASKKQVNITYQGVNDKKPQNRQLEPIGLYHDNGFWYIAAFCILRNDYRQFRADRIAAVELNDTEFLADRISLENFLQKQKDSYQKTKIVIATSLETARHFHWERTHFGFQQEYRKNDKVYMTFEYGGSMEYFARWILMFADDSHIVEPLSLKERIKEILEMALQRISGNNNE